MSKDKQRIRDEISSLESERNKKQLLRQSINQVNSVVLSVVSVFFIFELGKNPINIASVIILGISVILMLIILFRTEKYAEDEKIRKKYIELLK